MARGYTGLIFEDVSVENLMSGKPSGESQEFFRGWLDQRGKGVPSQQQQIVVPRGTALRSNKAK
jgi:hypothetical protein